MSRAGGDVYMEGNGYAGRVNNAYHECVIVGRVKSEPEVYCKIAEKLEFSEDPVECERAWEPAGGYSERETYIKRGDRTYSGPREGLAADMRVRECEQTLKRARKRRRSSVTRGGLSAVSQGHPRGCSQRPARSRLWVPLGHEGGPGSGIEWLKKDMASGSRHTSRSVSALRCIALHRAALSTVGLFWPCLSGHGRLASYAASLLIKRAGAVMSPVPLAFPHTPGLLAALAGGRGRPVQRGADPEGAPFRARLAVQWLREGRIEIARANALVVRAARDIPRPLCSLPQLLGAIGGM